tara:strand:+ start:15928 stop:16398 length:471 start_codon:yes stop_codon:yes gene_type:complete
MKKLLLPSLLLATLSGCTAIPALDSSSPDFQKSMSFEPVQNKAVLYIYRSKLSDFQGVTTSVDIGEVELSIFPNCMHRFELSAGSYNFEPNGIGAFSIEDELNITMEKGSVNFVELRHESRIAIPNKSSLIKQSKDDANRVLADDELCIVPIKIVG